MLRMVTAEGKTHKILKISWTDRKNVETLTVFIDCGDSRGKNRGRHSDEEGFQLIIRNRLNFNHFSKLERAEELVKKKSREEICGRIWPVTFFYWICYSTCCQPVVVKWTTKTRTDEHLTSVNVKTSIILSCLDTSHEWNQPSQHYPS